MPKITLARVSGEFGFEATDENNHTVRMDSSPESGGQNFGVRPMQMLLMGIGACSAIDVLAILKKQRQEVKDYKMVINGEREQGKEPSLWKEVDLEFYLYGNIDKDKAEKAVELAINKYCSVSTTLEKAGAKINWKVFVRPAQ
jgi:putative redox protein